MGEETPVNTQAEIIAKEILLLSRDTLLVKLRFLDAAISQLRLQPKEWVSYLATDGQILYYLPRQILHAYKTHPDSVARDYLHVIFHCLFHNLFINKTVQKDCWDLACDIANENAINDLGQNTSINYRTSKQAKVISELKGKMSMLTAEKIYRYYLDQDLSNEQLATIRNNFIVDNHFL